MIIPPSMRQIAERAGVNRSTVSLALRNDPRLKLETRQKIQALAKEMGYQQNPTVSHLMTQLRAGQKKHFQSNIALLNFGNLTVENQLLAGARERATNLGYGLEVFQVAEFPPPRLEQILVNRGFRGIIINALWGVTTIPPVFSSLWNRFAACCLGIHPNNPQLHFVGDDNYYTSMTAVEKLAQLGFTRIGFAMHSGINIETEYRFIGGYLTGHVTNPQLTQLPVFYVGPSNRDEFLSWFSREKPQVILCVQEEIQTWLLEDGYRVPKDVSLVHLDLGVTTGKWAGMRQARALRGKIAVDLVVSQIVHNENGVPAAQIAMLTESTWEPGATLAHPVKGKSRARSAS